MCRYPFAQATTNRGQDDEYEIKKRTLFLDFQLGCRNRHASFCFVQRATAKSAFKELNAETAEIMKQKSRLSALADLPTPSSAALAEWESGIKETHVRKTVCSDGWCVTDWVPKSPTSN
jgi:hypothetical protein